MSGTGVAGRGRGSGGGSGGEMLVSLSLEGKRESVVVGVDDEKMPVIGSTGVTPTFEDGGSSLVDCLDIILGEDDDEVGIRGGNAKQGSGE
jgi:hypothetical protein